MDHEQLEFDFREPICAPGFVKAHECDDWHDGECSECCKNYYVRCPHQEVWT